MRKISEISHCEKVVLKKYRIGISELQTFFRAEIPHQCGPYLANDRGNQDVHMICSHVTTGKDGF